MSPVRKEIMFIYKWIEMFFNYGVFIFCYYPCLPTVLAVNDFSYRVSLAMIFKAFQEVWSNYEVLNQKFPLGNS